MLHRVTTKYVCGIDLHAKTLAAVVLDLSGKVLKKRSVPCALGEVMDFLRPFHPHVTVGVESTYNWYWLLDGLEDEGVTCVLGHALYISKGMSSKHKNDPGDARGIAELLRTNRFPLAYAYPREMRVVRDMLRRRHFFVQRRGGTFTHFQCSLHQDGCIEPLRNKLQYKSTRDSLVQLGRTPDLRKMLTVDLDYVKALDTIVDDLDTVIRQRAQHHNPKHLAALQTMPGCGEITALTILYETHNIDRFSRVQRYCSYCRVVRADNESGGKKLGHSSNDRIGNPHLKWAFSEIGAAMLRCSPPIRSWHQEQAELHGKAGAHARLRHKTAATVFYMLKHDRVFDLRKFVGEKHMDQAPSPAHNRTEPSGQPSEPSRLIGTAPGPSSPESLPEQTPPKDTPKKKRPGRPPLPRDSMGRIIRTGRSPSKDRPASPAYNRTESSGPPSEPSALIVPPDGPCPETATDPVPAAPVKKRRGRPPLPRDEQGRIIRPSGHAEAPRREKRRKPAQRARERVHTHIDALSDEDIARFAAILEGRTLRKTTRGRPSLRTTGHRTVLTQSDTLRR